MVRGVAILSTDFHNLHEAVIWILDAEANTY
jgi:hypothetical protein